ncbi:hypothetical protein Tco_0329644, partial [Tanacetum coccineum]
AHPKRGFVPQAVLTRSGKINTAGASINTADRPVNIVGSKTTTIPDQLQMLSKEKIHMSQGLLTVLSENKGKGANAVKASACWIWKAKSSSASNTFKKYSYIDARGRSKSIMAWIPKRA